MKNLFEELKGKMEERGYKVTCSQEEPRIEICNKSTGETWEIQVATKDFMINKIIITHEEEVTILNLSSSRPRKYIEDIIDNFEKDWKADEITKADQFTEYLEEEYHELNEMERFYKRINLYYLDEPKNLSLNFKKDFLDALENFITVKSLEEGTMEIKDNSSQKYYELFIEKEDPKITQFLIGYRETSHFTLLKFEEKVSSQNLLKIILREQANPDWTENNIIKIIDKVYPIANKEEVFPDKNTYSYMMK